MGRIQGSSPVSLPEVPSSRGVGAAAMASHLRLHSWGPKLQSARIPGIWGTRSFLPVLASTFYKLLQ